MKNYRLYLVRHGITAGNLQRRYIGGGTDEPLCGQGLAQLKALAAQYRYPWADTVFSSPMKRAGHGGGAFSRRREQNHSGGPA